MFLEAEFLAAGATIILTPSTIILFDSSGLPDTPPIEGTYHVTMLNLKLKINVILFCSCLEFFSQLPNMSCSFCALPEK